MNAFITWHPNFIPTFPIDLRRNPSVMSRPTKTADISRKQPTFYESSRHFATPPLVFPARWRLRKKCRNSILMTCRYLDLGYPFWLVEENFPPGTTNQEHHSDLGGDTSTVCYQADLATEQEHQLTTPCANQTTGLTKDGATIWAPEVEYNAFRALSVLVPQTSIREETSSVAKCPLFLLW